MSRLPLWRSFRTTFFCAGLLLAGTPALAEVTISWARNALGTATDQQAVRGAPNGTFGGLGVSTFMYALNFNQDSPQLIERTYKGGLGQLLGLKNDEDLKQWDILAFEIHSRKLSPPGGGWESSIWFITDLVNAIAGPFDGTKAPDIRPDPVPNSLCRRLWFKTGTITPAAYETFFGFKGFSHQSKPRAAGSIAWILIDVPGDVDTRSRTFRIWVSGAKIGPNGSPDPESFGVIRH